MTVADPQGAADLAEDQLFALNPALGTAFVLGAAEGGQYATQVQLPVLGHRAAEMVFLRGRSCV